MNAIPSHEALSPSPLPGAGSPSTPTCRAVVRTLSGGGGDGRPVERRAAANGADGRKVPPPPAPPSLAAVIDLALHLREPAILESSAWHAELGRRTLIAAEPLRVLTLREGVLTRSCPHAPDIVLARGEDAEIWAAIESELTAVRCEPCPLAGPYLPGWIGYVGYEVGRHIERLPARAGRDTALPDLRLALYDALLVHDSADGAWRCVELDFAEPPPGAGQAGERLRRTLEQASEAPGLASPPSAEAHARPLAPAQSNFRPDAYRAAVARCVEYIAAGDIFQVNLSQRFTVHPAPPPQAIYRALRTRNPAWYAAFLQWDADGRSCALCSSSPELFLRVRGDHVLTRPIKGTRGRCGDPALDAAAAAELLASPKDNAELAMIIDLLRNDLGKVCRFSSVRVTDARRLETHPTVYHLVGTVEGRLRQGVGPVELLRATFPGGSITGAPKIRAMQIIDELEPVARGVYTGSIGILGADGSAEWNIAIRTVVCDGDTAYVQAGGGIVADSDPQLEYEETLHKARALLEAIAAAMAR